MDPVHNLRLAYRLINFFLMNKFLDYLIIAFYWVFIRLIKVLTANTRRNGYYVPHYRDPYDYPPRDPYAITGYPNY